MFGSVPEDGQIVALPSVMRFDDSLERMLGSQLEPLAAQAPLHLRRELRSASLYRASCSLRSRSRCDVAEQHVAIR